MLDFFILLLVLFLFPFPLLLPVPREDNVAARERLWERLPPVRVERAIYEANCAALQDLPDYPNR